MTNTMQPEQLRQWIDEHCGGNQTRAAHAMGIAPQNLRLRLNGRRPITWWDRLMMGAIVAWTLRWRPVDREDDDPNLSYHERVLIQAIKDAVRPWPIEG